MANVIFLQPFDLSHPVTNWTPPDPVTNVESLVFTNGDLRLELDSKGASPITLLSYQNGQITGRIGEIHLYNAAGEVLWINNQPTMPGQILGQAIPGNVSDWLSLLGVLGGDDTIKPGAGNDSIDAGGGFDTATWTGNLADYKVVRNGSGYTVTHLADGSVDTLLNVERFDFGDKFVAADVTPDSVGGQVFRMYRAAFDRAPDANGLQFWTHAMDSQGVKLEAIADAFIHSSEYQARYGTGLSNHDLVAAYYTNVLHRAADQAGLNFWTAALDGHAATNAQVLAAISDSPENVAGTAALIGNGLVLDYPIVT